jgi:voltage-gated sodium channel
VLTSFAVLNLFIAVIVDSMQSKHFDAETERQAEAHDEREVLVNEVKALRVELAEIRVLLQSRDGAPADRPGSAMAPKRDDKDE